MRAAERGPRLFRRSDPAANVDDFVFAGLVLVLAWLPLPLGSNHLISWSINAVLLSALLAAFEIGKLVTGGRRPVAIRRIGWAAVLLAVLIGWIVFQLTPYAPSGWQNDFWALARSHLDQIALVGVVEGRISVAPDAGMIGLMRLVTCAAAFYLALQLCRDRLRADLLMMSFIVISVAYALFGIVLLLLFPDSLLWEPKVAYVDSLTSFFVNRNNYATYAGMGVIATLGVLFESYRRAGSGRGVPWAQRIAALIEMTPRVGLPLMVALVVIGIALLWTTSRAGVTTTLIGAVMLLLMIGLLARRKAIMLGLIGAIVAGGALLMFVYGGALAERLADAGGGEMRLNVTRRTFEAALDVPWTGFGYGSFDRMFAVYRADLALEAHWDKAHDTYVELLFDLGFPGAILFFALAGGLVGMVAVGLMRRESRPMICLVTLAIATQVFLHAIVDFSLQIQAVTITFWTLVGAGLAQSWSRQIDTSA
ncbi:O-antigen ligase family protein [Ancylobacter sp. MQZ15Z-1]|uniref:O-antigen ligase family protein n=1 Tax=Ancylobacter mangrovi TaxID=2972472 RepID=A0A9X2PC79_9HYPH|nr:O-antigen ligase family protein [Ancylobacter mangrovi]MCS0496092.1 O-antigen ligase family protein [Ancylobacter mangrovi]